MTDEPKPTTPQIEVDSWFVELGGRLSGRVTLPGMEGTHPTTERIREVRVGLCYETEGRGDRDRWNGPTQSFGVNVDGSLFGQLELDVPIDAPISYDGSLFRVRWTVEARTDLRMRIDPKTSVEFVVIPARGLGHYRRPHPLPSMAR